MPYFKNAYKIYVLLNKAQQNPERKQWPIDKISIIIIIFDKISIKMNHF